MADLMDLVSECDWPAALGKLRAQHPQSCTCTAEFNVTNEEGWNPLMICLCYGAPPLLIKEIIKKSGCGRVRDKLGMSPLHLAARSYQGSQQGGDGEDRIQIFRALIAAWPESLEVAEHITGKTPLMMAHVPVSRQEPRSEILELLKEGEQRLREWKSKNVVLMSVKRHVVTPFQRFMPPVDIDGGRKRGGGSYKHEQRNLRFAANALIEIKDRKAEGIYDLILEYAFGRAVNAKSKRRRVSRERESEAEEEEG
mmetsp:Transcript_13799/g.28251  ORF Transcript_13799/g.28251 Transcript_13799/m.28251 type:complete len:254 (+) Transcript_13799:195-956(+)